MPRSILRAYRLRCYATAAQRQRLERDFGAARRVWNRALQYRRKAYRRRGESVTGVDFSRPLTRLKRPRRYGWLREIPSTVLTQKLRDQDRVFANIFADRAGYPKFRQRRAACRAEHDRDVNAGKNLEQEGLRLLTVQRPAGPGRSMRVEGNTPGRLPALSGRGPLPDAARTDSTGPRRYATAAAA